MVLIVFYKTGPSCSCTRQDYQQTIVIQPNHTAIGNRTLQRSPSIKDNSQSTTIFPCPCKQDFWAQPEVLQLVLYKIHKNKNGFSSFSLKFSFAHPDRKIFDLEFSPDHTTIKKKLQKNEVKQISNKRVIHAYWRPINVQMLQPSQERNPSPILLFFVTHDLWWRLC